ncbi:galactose/methyl galactoside import ATP-binding protein MglA [bacterium BMS3Abin02]|nr:galactose/methyl galactoside import ATP-binding protein MglA [bacterium BMS3Abin02]GBE23451.1 galactose/methyl galactoside import ATP-binding protein MglA [bacterium BMS3Bbin01]HDH26089.1 sugar ABC transporter ATP-binding protein [Actinomycetota bacterium]
MTHLIEADSISKYFGTVTALTNVSACVNEGEVTCILGDNGAGKSTFIKILSGLLRPDDGEYRIDGKPVNFTSPREALDAGIATVYQDLAMVPLMAVWRNFFLGSEPERGIGLFKRVDVAKAKRTVVDELGKMGIVIRDPEQPVGTLSGGERQSVAIARAVYFGARVLILDEPTASLGVKQAGVVLRYVVNAKKRGLGVILITHNPHHAYPVGDHFVILRRGEVYGDYLKKDIPLGQLVQMMAGGAELETLQHELEKAAAQTGEEELAEAATAFGEESDGLGLSGDS